MILSPARKSGGFKVFTAMQYRVVATVGMTYLATFFLALAACVVLSDAAYKLEPWYEGLYYFGDSCWDGTCSMDHVADFTLQLKALRIDLSSRGEYMFVSPGPTPTPPLGDKNWKQGKIGVGEVIGYNASTLTTTQKLYPGGGSGFWPSKGVYDLTLRTAGHPTNPNTIEFRLSDGTNGCVVNTDKFLYNTPAAGQSVRVEGTITFAKPTPPGDFTFSSHDLPAQNIASTVIATAQSSGLVYNFNVSLQNSSPEFVNLFVNITTSSDPTSSCTWKLWNTNRTEKGARWGKLFQLRDSSNQYPDTLGDKALQGWHVTPIHAIVLSDSGHLLISGFLRRDGMPCAGGTGSGGRRRAAITFILDGINELGDNATGTIVNVTRIEENSECSFEQGPTGHGTEACVRDNVVFDGDSVYCAGHTTLEDGRVFYTGGARYGFMSSPKEHEYGLDYARLFSQKTNSFETILDHRMPLGRSWYPTAGRLADGRVLVTGAFTDYSTEFCLGPKCYNPQINLFDVKKHDAGENPWSVLINKQYGQEGINPGIREYTRVFVLPKPKAGPDGIERDVLLMGKSGTVWLLSTDDVNVPMENRYYNPPNGKRPIDCADKHGGSDQSTAVHLTTRGGELLVMGGCTGNMQALQQIDLYNVQSDSWESFPAHIMRGVPASVIMPDGRVLILSGEDKTIDQNIYRNKDAKGDTRHPQIFDPYTKQLVTVEAAESEFRGYHNMAALLRDGSIVVGGGFNQYGDVGCENPNIRRFYPSYMGVATKPSFASNSKLTLFPGNTSIEIDFNGPELDSDRGAALLAVQAFTHSYGQNQRYVRLTIISQTTRNGSGRTVAVDVPGIPEVLPGHYHLFLLSKDGIPSEGIHTEVKSTYIRNEKSKEKKGVASGAESAMRQACFTAAVTFLAIGTIVL